MACEFKSSINFCPGKFNSELADLMLPTGGGGATINESSLEELTMIRIVRM